jgi:ABC-type nitrate/sulfonate/bicarbonate transport system permease component
MQVPLLLQRWSGTILCVLTWFLITDLLKLVSPLLLPSLQSVTVRLFETLIHGEVLLDLYATTYRWVYGFSSGALCGTILGLCLGVTPYLYRAFELPLEFLRALPVVALFPLFLMLFGIGDEAKIALAFVPTFLVLLINAFYGVSNSAPERRRMAKAFGATSLQSFFRITCFEALPQIFIGLRLALSLSLIATVVSEMFIGTEFGFGQRIYDAYLMNAPTTLYAHILILGTLGYLMNKLLLVLEHRYIFWAGR